MPEILGKKIAQATVNAYASCLLVKTPTFIRDVMFVIEELNVGAIEFEILGSLDGSTWVSIQSTTDLAKDGVVAATLIASPWIYLDLQIRSNAEGVPGSVTAWASGW